MNNPYIAANAVIEAAVRAGNHNASVNMLAITVDGTRMVMLYEGCKQEQLLKWRVTHHPHRSAIMPGIMREGVPRALIIGKRYIAYSFGTP